MTIIKSQTPYTKKVKLWLEQPTFTHGQLYASRVGETQHLNFAAKKIVSRKTRNVAYKEILYGSVHSDRGAVDMFIAEFRPSQGYS